jgi:transposase InsO family protein
LAGFRSVCFVTDVCSRRILGWRVSMSKRTTDLVAAAPSQALSIRRRTDLHLTATRLVHPAARDRDIRRYPIMTRAPAIRQRRLVPVLRTSRQ